MRVSVMGQVLNGTGYGEYARLLAWAVHATGHRLQTRNYAMDPEEPSRLGHKGELAMSYLGRDVGSPVDLSLLVYVPTSFPVLTMDGVTNVGVAMTENDLVHPSYVTMIDDSDVLVLGVPSEWNREPFREAGLETPTMIIHPPVDSDLWHRSVRRRCDVVDFLSIFHWPAPHKNPDALLEAFCVAFKPEDPVRLVIKTSGATGEEIADSVHAAMRRAGVTRSPQIQVMCGSMTRAEILALYSRSDVYVSSHRGEGWGLPIFESMAIGMPAIATEFSAPLEYMHEGNSYLVPGAYNIEKGNVDVDVDALASAMWRAFTQADEAQALGETARYELRRRFTAEHTMSQIIEAARLAEEIEPPQTAITGR